MFTPLPFSVLSGTFPPQSATIGTKNGRVVSYIIDFNRGIPETFSTHNFFESYCRRIFYHGLCLTGQLRLQDVFLDEPLKIIAHCLYYSKPLFPFTHVNAGNSPSKPCISLKRDYHPLGGLHNPLLITVIFDVVPLFLQARYREQVSHAIFVDPHVKFTVVSILGRGCHTYVTVTHQDLTGLSHIVHHTRHECGVIRSTAV